MDWVDILLRLSVALVVPTGGAFAAHSR